MVAALSKLHHGVDQVGHVCLSRSFSQEGEVLLQDGSVVFLLNVGELHLDDGLLLGGQFLLHVLLQPAEHHGLQDSLKLLHLWAKTEGQSGGILREMMVFCFNVHTLLAEYITFLFNTVVEKDFWTPLKLYSI